MNNNSKSSYVFNFCTLIIGGPTSINSRNIILIQFSQGGLFSKYTDWKQNTRKIEK